MATMPPVSPYRAPAPIQSPDIAGNYQNLLQLSNSLQNGALQREGMQQENQQRAIQLQQAQQGQQDQAAFRAAMQDPSFQGKTIGDVADHLAKTGKISQTAWTQAKKADLEQRQTLATLDKDQLANMDAAHKQTQKLYDSVMDLPDDQLAAQWPQIAQQYDAIPGNNKQPMDPNQPLTKQQLQQFGPLISMQRVYLDEATERQKKQADLAKTTAQTAGEEAKNAFYAKNGGAPGVPLEAQNQADWLQRHPGKTAADYAVSIAGAKAGAEESARLPGEMALARQRQALSQGDPKAAAQLLVDGDATLSELKSRGATPEFIARTLYTAKQLSGGQYNAQSAEAQFNVAKSPANTAFFGSAKSLTDKGGTLDQLAEAGKSIPQSDITALNTVADWQKASTGNGPLAHYAATALGVADDYAKVMGGGQGSDTSRAQALHLIQANAGPDARAGALKGIRGAVDSQVNSRIGNNGVMKRMYGSPANASASASPAQGVTVTAPNGKTYSFKDQQAADNFKRSAGIQ